MKTYFDFHLISPYSTYINNQKWIFSFMPSKILVSIEESYTIYNTRCITRETCKFNSYIDCFMDILNEINQLYFCNLCKRFDKVECKVCIINKIVDELPTNLENDCPVCYNKLTVRHSSICGDERHLLCGNCHDEICLKSKKCPICRSSNSELRISIDEYEGPTI